MGVNGQPVQQPFRSLKYRFPVFSPFMQQWALRHRLVPVTHPSFWKPPSPLPASQPLTYWAIPRWGCAALGFHHPACVSLGRARSSRVGCVLLWCKQETEAAAAEGRKRAKLKSQRKKKKKRSSNCTKKRVRRQVFEHLQLHTSAPSCIVWWQKQRAYLFEAQNVPCWQGLQPIFHLSCLKFRHLKSGFQTNDEGSWDLSCAEQSQEAKQLVKKANTQCFLGGEKKVVSL